MCINHYSLKITLDYQFAKYLCVAVVAVLAVVFVIVMISGEIRKSAVLVYMIGTGMHGGCQQP